MKYNTFCPLFSGFYGSIFEYDSEDSDIDNYNEEHGTNLGYDDFEWYYREYHLRISQAIMNAIETRLNELLPVKMTFEKLHSPKEYNFYNDSIWCDISLSLDRLLKLIRERREQATQYFKDKYTSCSGFISFHSNSISDWLNKAYILEDTGHRVGALLDCLCSIEGMEENDIYYDISGEMWIDYSPKVEAAPIPQQTKVNNSR